MSIKEKRLDLGNAPFDLKFQRDIQHVAGQLDAHFNYRPGPRRWGMKGDRKVGFCLLLFSFNRNPTDCTVVSNGASDDDLMVMFEHMLAKLKEEK